MMSSSDTLGRDCLIHLEHNYLLGYWHAALYVSGLIIFAPIVALRLHVGLRSGALFFVLLSETIASQSPCFCLTRGQL